MGLSVGATPNVMSTRSKLCQRVIRAEKREWNRVKGKLAGLRGQAEGNNGLPTITTIFEHYCLVCAPTRIFEWLAAFRHWTLEPDPGQAAGLCVREQGR